MEAMETGTEDLLARREGADGEVAVLTLNRPQRRNALSPAMLEALARVLVQSEQDASVRCIVLTGTAPAFCAGGDVKAMAEQEGGAGGGASFEGKLRAQRASQRATVGRIYNMPKPVIAALPGAAAGAGLGLCMACDLRIAADSAVMTTAFARVGLSGDYGLPWLLTEQLGRAKAMELFYLSDKLTADQCLSLGLVHRVVPAAELQAATLELALRLANGPTVALGYIKENLNAAQQLALEPFMDGEVMRHLSSARTEDHAEATQAFVERRPPRFRGR